MAGILKSAKNCSHSKGYFSGEGRRGKFFSGDNIKPYRPLLATPTPISISP